MTTTRVDPPREGGEAEVLLGYLAYHRETLRMKCEGLTAAQLDTTLPPSDMTLGGMLKHLAYVEHWWFNEIYAGHAPAEPWASVDWEVDHDWDWHSAAGADLAELRELFDGEVARSEQIVASALETPQGLTSSAARRSQRDPSQGFNLRWILVHMIEEYARHNGHADLIRQSIDGSTGE